VKKFSAIKQLEPFDGEPSELNVAHAAWGRLIDEDDPGSIFNIVKLINLLRFLGLPHFFSEKQEAGVLIALGARIKHELLAGNERFFRVVADLIKQFPPAETPPNKTYWPLVSPEYFAATNFFAERPGEFTRKDLAAWIEKETGKRPPASTITEILNRFHRKPRKQKPPGRPPKN
jgi:hypothetical protein